MDENTNPQGATPLETALRQIQAWFVNGDFEKVRQGCREVLIIAPNNSIAQDLLNRAEQSEAPAPQTRSEAEGPAPLPPPPPAFVPSIPEATPPPPPAPEPILEEPPMPEMVVEPPVATPSHEEDNIHHSHSLAINIAILVGIVVVGILGIYGYNAFIKGGDETPPAQEEDAEEQTRSEAEGPAPAPSNSDEIPSDATSSPDLTTWQGRNEKRSEDLSELEQALILYFDEFKKYPNTDEIGTTLLTELPTPPSDGEAYVYAVYGNDIGADQVFVLSAEFEQENGEKTVWSTGGSPNEYPDYRDVAAPHVTTINPTMTEIEYLEFLSSQYPETPAPTPNAPPSGRVPRMPRN